MGHLLCPEAPPQHPPSPPHFLAQWRGSWRGCSWPGALRLGSSAVGADIPFVAPSSNSSPYSSGYGAGHSSSRGGGRGATWEGNPICPGAGAPCARWGQPLGWGPWEGTAAGEPPTLTCHQAPACRGPSLAWRGAEAQGTAGEVSQESGAGAGSTCCRALEPSWALIGLGPALPSQGCSHSCKARPSLEYAQHGSPRLGILGHPRPEPPSWLQVCMCV